MGSEVIKSFLVGLGFGVDDASLAKFNKAVASATLKVTALYGSVKLMSAAVVYGISKISESFEQMGYEYRIIAPAINKALILRRELLKAYAAAGLNITKTVQASVRLNMSLTKTRFAFKAIYDSVAAKFFPLLTKQSDLFRQKIYANLPRIQLVLEKMVKFIFKALEATTILGMRLWSILQRVYDFFAMLDEKTEGWSTIILGLITAWKLLNLSFLATPLGMLLVGFAALLALWDDFKTFREGGESLINWGSDTTKMIVGLGAAIAVTAGAIWIGTQAIKAFTFAIEAWKAIQEIIAIVKGLNSVLGVTDILLIALEAPFWAIAGAITAIIAGLTLADAKWQLFGGHLSGFFSGIGGKIMDFVAGTNVAANLQGAPGGVPQVPPLGGNVQNSQTNQNVNQQTSINVMGTADANAVGKQVAGEQGKVNFDMVRNLKPRTR